MFSGIQLIPPADIRSWRVRRLTEYWEAKRGAAILPAREDFELGDLTALLPYMLVTAIEADPFRVFYRLDGTKIVEMNGVELHGRYLDELREQQAWVEDGTRVYRQAWENCEARFGAYTWPTQLGSVCHVEFGIFPVTFRGERSQCLALEDWSIGDDSHLRHDRPLPFIGAE